jgi:hypothetical protein
VKTYYVDAAAGERHLLVRMASSAVSMLRDAMDVDTRLTLRNQAAIMQALVEHAHGPVKRVLAQPEPELLEGSSPIPPLIKRTDPPGRLPA